MQPIANNGYTAEEVLAALRAPTRTWSFRYELLDSDNKLIEELSNVLSASVEQNALAEIKRTAKFRIKAEGNIDYLSDRIKPYVRLGMPDGGHVEWPQGVFLLSSPTRQTTATGSVIREIDAYDQLLVLQDDKVTDRYTVNEGASYVDAINTLLSGFDKNVAPKSDTLPAARDWAPGTSKLAIINELLGAINYESLFFDADGVAIARQYRSPQSRASEFEYVTDSKSIVFQEASEELDIYSVANRWVLVVSEPDQTPLVSTYTNDNPASPTSTVNRGRTIVDFRESENASNQATLDAKAERLAFNASQIYQAVEFETGLTPFHETNDVYRLNFSDLNINSKYSEHKWSMELTSGARVKHRARRVINI